MLGHTVENEKTAHQNSFQSVSSSAALVNPDSGTAALADRAGAAVARALVACAAPKVEIDAVLKARSVVLTICAGDAGWSHMAAAALAHLGAAACDGCVTLGLERTPLAGV